MLKNDSRAKMRAAFCFGIMTLTLCRAQNPLWTGEYSRKGKWEIHGSVEYLVGDTATFSSTGLSLQLDDTFTGGAGFGYHFLDCLSIDVDLFGGSARFTGRDVFGSPATTSDATLFGGNVNLNYNILKRRLTPVITGGVGLINFSGGGFSETDPSANVGGGLRWDITDRFFIKVMGGVTWTEIQGDNGYNLFTAEGAILLKSISVSGGYKF